MSVGPEAGWYPEPGGGPDQRYWDGMAWSGHTRPGQGHPPPAGPYGPGPALPPPIYGGYGWSPWTPSPPTNDLAIASLICSIATVFTGFGCIIGIVLGHVALVQIKRRGEQGKGLAIAGLTVGYVLLALEILAVILVVSLVNHIHVQQNGRGTTLSSLYLLG